MQKRIVFRGMTLRSGAKVFCYEMRGGAKQMAQSVKLVRELEMKSHKRLIMGLL